MAAEDIDEDVHRLLRGADQRYTRGRRRVVAALHEAGNPLTIPEILELEPTLAQSSVYRNLSILEDVGVVTRIVTGHDHARFELAEDLTGHHHHLICSSCGEVSDFSLATRTEQALDRALREVAARTAFAVDGHRLDLMGTCQTCT